MSKLFFFLVTCAALAGCGLTLDYDPRPDGGPPGIDSGGLGGDAGRADAGDSGPQRCFGPSDCGADGDPCNGVERCDLKTGACVVDPAVTCPPGDACSTSTCVPGVGCASAPTACPDDGFECTVEACDPSDGGCSSSPNDSACGTPRARCFAMQCDPNRGCVEVDLCTEISTDGRCEASTGICNFNSCLASCAPIGPCSIDAFCEGMACRQVLQTVGHACQTDACNAGTCDEEGRCMTAPVDCNDNNPCTIDRCDPALGCVRTPRIGACDTDNNVCTSETCVGTQCTRAPASDLVCLDADPTDCVDVFCDPTGGCSTRTVTSGQTCNDRVGCTSNDRCDAVGRCVGAERCLELEPGNLCTQQVCNFISGMCEPIDLTGSSCGIANVCDGPTCCLLGTTDCDGIPSNGCECNGTCLRAIGARAGVCQATADPCNPSPCPEGQTCCPCGSAFTCVFAGAPCSCAM